jgi:hypothetical protein
VLVDIVSGDIKPVEWKQGTTDTLELLPVKDSIMAITDEDYFDWPVLPEAPSSLTVSMVADSSNLSWVVHGGNADSIVVERRIENQNGKGESWTQIARLPANAVKYTDANIKSGQQLGYRIRALNANGPSAYSNVVRLLAK